MTHPRVCCEKLRLGMSPIECQDIPDRAPGHPQIYKKTVFKVEKESPKDYRDQIGQSASFTQKIKEKKNQFHHKFNAIEKYLGKRRLRFDGWHSVLWPSCPRSQKLTLMHGRNPPLDDTFKVNVNFVFRHRPLGNTLPQRRISLVIINESKS